MSPPQVVVAGAGIGGLSAALALARCGYAVTVLERALVLEEAGAGVQLAANATRCLAALGVLERAREVAVNPRAFRVMDGRRGVALAEAEMADAVAARFGGPFLVIHRADLQQVLLEAVRREPLIRLLLGRTIEGFEEEPGVVAVDASGSGRLETHSGLALIGADGVRSVVRRQLQPRALPVYQQRAAWRATVPVEALPPDLADPVTRLWLGPGAHLVSYPVRAGREVNLVAVTPDKRGVHGWGLDADPAELLRHYAGWSAQARALLAAPAHWLRWALYDLEPMESWGTGRVTLLGDAAHAMLPFLAQGAAQAIEDSAVLAAELAGRADDIPAALRRYEARRMDRTARVQTAARGMARIYHLAGPARLARDLVMRARSGEAMLERYRWIYEWQP
ncbi:FAD-dependent monooxygenase [Ancylobacter sp. G4_0304]|uniref:FAD-dependent monooxygenase n=1 Tax=Ancylobacter sp. G4_0304 TaxID=3114289 RepID=UPI0039C64E9D